MKGLSQQDKDALLMKQEAYPQIKIREHIKRADSASTVKARAFIDRGAGCRLTDLIFRPLFAFLKCILSRRQIFKGTSGITISVLKAYEEFITYLKLWELRHVQDGGEK